jgi:hypothetical protein
MYSARSCLLSLSVKYLFISCGLLTTLSVSQNYGIECLYDKKLIGKDVEGRLHGVIEKAGAVAMLVLLDTESWKVHRRAGLQRRDVHIEIHEKRPIS